VINFAAICCVGFKAEFRTRAIKFIFIFRNFVLWHFQHFRTTQAHFQFRQYTNTKIASQSTWNRSSVRVVSNWENEGNSEEENIHYIEQDLFIHAQISSTIFQFISNLTVRFGGMIWGVSSHSTFNSIWVENFPKKI
jgi:hypothetical protein